MHARPCRLIAAATVAAAALIAGSVPATTAGSTTWATASLGAAPDTSADAPVAWRDAPMETSSLPAELVTVTGVASTGVASSELELQRTMPGTAAASPELLAGAEGIAPFLLIGFSWDGPADTTARFRVHNAAGWSPWRAVETDDGHAPDQPAPAGGRVTSAPTWVGPSDGWQLGTGSDAAALTVHLVAARAGGSGDAVDDAGAGFERQRTNPLANATLGGQGARSDGGSDASLGAARVGVDQPPIALRFAWGARPPAQETWIAQSLRVAVVHHTGSGESSTYAAADVPAMLRAVQAYHIDANGWSDIGYNFVVDRFGRIWEGRDGGIDTLTVGAHALGMNTGSVGVVILGDFRAAQPSPEALAGVERLLAWKLFRHGADPAKTGTILPRSDGLFPAFNPVTLPRIVGHQDVSQTGCPGNVEAFLPAIRAAVTAGYRSLLGEATLEAATIGMPAAAGTPFIGDFDKNGTDDVFWHRPGSEPDELWRSDGSFGFTTSTVPLDNAVDSRPDTAVTVLDWDGDGADDLLFSTPGRTTVTLLLGARSGTFSAVTLNASGSAQPVVGDFDGDGDDDVLFYDPTRTALPFMAFGVSGPLTKQLSITGGPYRFVVGDFNGDLRDDVVFYAPWDGADAVWYGRTDGVFDVAPVSAGGDFSPVAADLDGDQRDDIIWRSATGGFIPLWWGGPAFIGGAVDYGPSVVLDFADLNGGGSDDVVAVTDSGWATAWLRQDADQRIARAASVPTAATPVPADFNGDGRAELWWWSPGASAGLPGAGTTATVWRSG